MMKVCTMEVPFWKYADSGWWLDWNKIHDNLGPDGSSFSKYWQNNGFA